MPVAEVSAAPLSLRHAPLVLAAPELVFRRIGENASYGPLLLALFLFSVAVGWATVQTGLIDREVDRQTAKALADAEREQIDLLSATDLSTLMENIRRQGEFTKLIAAGSAVILKPLGTVATLLLVAAMLFAVVAWSGNKADYATLMAICVYSATVDALAAGLRLAMMLYYGSLEVDTSLGLLAPVSEKTLVLRTILSGVDPLRAWFWVLVGVGLVVTGQLSRGRAALTCATLGLLACVVQVAVLMAPQMQR